MTGPGTTVGALLAGLVDDAGLFPPEELAMPAAVARHRADTAAAHPVLTQRFLCPAARLPELTAALADGDRFALGLITPLTPGAVRSALEHLAAEPRLRLASAEGPLPAGPASALAAWQALDALRELPSGLPCYAEIPFTAGWRDALAVLADAGAGVGAKVRCGGVRAELFPTAAQLAAFVRACAELRLPFKATAGLHHAVRYRDERTGFTHHGFLNLLLATRRAAAGGSLGDVVGALRSDDAAALAAEARAVPAPLAADTRALFAAYGSCSTSEPLDDLRALDLTGPPGPNDKENHA